MSLRVALEKMAGQRNDESGCAESALGRSAVDKRLLNRGEVRPVEAFDRDDVAIGEGAKRHQARGHDLVPDVVSGPAADEDRT